MVINTLNRRSFLTAAAGFALPFAGYHQTHEKQPFLFVSSQKQADGNHAVVAVDEGGAIKFQEILPGRGHDTAISPDRKTGIIFARRPGRFAVVIDLRRQKQVFAFETPANRHFYGHGFFQQMGDYSLPAKKTSKMILESLEFTVLVTLTNALVSLRPRELDPIKSF